MQYFYQVRLGDTLNGIAKRWELPVESLVAANELTSPDTIWDGQQLAMPTGIHLYKVQAGDSVYSIAQHFGVPTATIIDTNALAPPYILRVNQSLKIPPGVPYYRVQEGDTLFDIASRYHVTVAGKVDPSLLQQVNNLSSDTIYPDMELTIPDRHLTGTGLLAYTASRDGQSDIWLYHMQSGEQEQLTKGIGDTFSAPVWSPDSNKLAFVGKDRIIYVVYLKTKLVAAIDQLTEGGDFSLDWSPDSKKLAYVARGVIVLYDTEDHEAKTVEEPGATNVNWFPNGGALLFQASDSTGGSQLFRVQTDGKNRQQLTHQEGGPLHDIRLSSDGNFAVYTTPGASLSLIYTIELSTGNVYEVKGGPLGKNYFPEWSPNSLQIAYSATAGGEGGYHSQIRTVGRTGEEDRVWTNSDCFETPVTWSPDGKKLAYLSGCQEQETANGVWVVDLNYPVPMQLFEANQMMAISWSPTQKEV